MFNIGKLIYPLIALLFVLIWIEYLLINFYKYKFELSKETITQLQKDIADQNNSIHQLVVAQNEKQKQIKKAQDDANKLREKYSKAAKKILAKNVSSNCDQAMQWGAEQGSIIYDCWAVDCKA